MAGSIPAGWVISRYEGGSTRYEGVNAPSYFVHGMRRIGRRGGLIKCFKKINMETEKKTGDKFFPGQSIKVMLLPFKQENTDRYRVAGLY